MARLFIDGFELGDFDCWDVNTAGGLANAVETSPIRSGTGTYCARFSTGANNYLTKNISPSSPSTVYLKAYVYYDHVGSYATEIITTINGTGNQLALCIEVSGYVSVRKTNRSGTALATGTILLSNSTWTLIEVYMVIGSSGTIQTKIAGVVDINFSGNTTNQAANTITGFYLGVLSSNYTGCYLYADDLVVDDAAWIGDGAILPLIPNGAGSNTQLTPSTAPNYSCVNAVPGSDSKNVSTNTPGNMDTYVKAAIGTSYSINSVQLTARAEGQGSPACGHLEHILYISGTAYAGAALSVPTGSYGNLNYLWQNNPATSAAFTPTIVNNMEIGMELVA